MLISNHLGEYEFDSSNELAVVPYGANGLLGLVQVFLTNDKNIVFVRDKNIHVLYGSEIYKRKDQKNLGLCFRNFLLFNNILLGLLQNVFGLMQAKRRLSTSYAKIMALNNRTTILFHRLTTDDNNY